ncbi:uncharacterized protein [Antedon mediterranea]|uniref:uncharacterized protein n=1 Tax=Antedon mediterranea TaxID=105859 RepID=UPI003AF5C9A4
MSTGDLLNNFRCLQPLLRSVNVNLTENRQKDLKKGTPQIFVDILRSVLLQYSRHIAQLITSHQIQLSPSHDDRFIDGVYKVLRDIFNYKPIISKEMFLRQGYAEHKLIMMRDVIKMVQAKKQVLIRKSKSKTKKTSSATSMGAAASFHGSVEILSPPALPESDDANLASQAMAIAPEPRTQSVNMMLSSEYRHSEDVVDHRPNVDRFKELCVIPPQQPLDHKEDEISIEPIRSNVGLVTRHLPSTNPHTPYLQNHDYFSHENTVLYSNEEETKNITNRISECLKLTDVLFSKLNNVVNRVSNLEEKFSGEGAFKVDRQKDTDELTEKFESLEKGMRSNSNRLVLMENQIVILNTLGGFGDRKLSTVQDLNVSSTTELIENEEEPANLSLMSLDIPAPSSRNLHHVYTSSPINQEARQTQVNRVSNTMKKLEYQLKPN